MLRRMLVFRRFKRRPCRGPGHALYSAPPGIQADRIVLAPHDVTISVFKAAPCR